uniref:Aminopeptidase YpdF (MP-, MA-, MS-, AP-, NP-specific) n=1 Tax=uncultured Armatimonadetes bacterium TaxID=157466 RepID=A0A6J4K818_9BACT|nr:Aminopeptidase YpdF (MP-, MA-, MS-, AP-, NP-specific) [uncultured Armatimonadetes bacterium]
MTDIRFPHRVAAVRARMAEPETRTGEDGSTETTAAPVEALIISHLENVRYLTGFTGSNGLVVLTAGAAHFLTDGRYALQSAAEVPGFERTILPQGSSLSEVAGQKAKELGLKAVGFEAAHLPYSAYAALAKAVPDGVSLIPRSGVVESVRAVKDADEIAAIRRAITVADACFDYLLTIARPGRTEREVAWDMEVFMRSERGATRLSFDSIVGSGPNSALIHGRPSGRRLGESGGPEFLLCDFGCEVDGYCSDITRTVCVGGEPTDRMRAAYDAVRAAQQAALDAIRPGVPGRDVDTLARKLLAEAGFGEMQHGLGHALGRVVHDGPGLSQKSDVTLAPGMVLTVEPGVYVENWGGVRIEDDIVVTESGCEILTRSTKDLVAVAGA